MDYTGSSAQAGPSRRGANDDDRDDDDRWDGSAPQEVKKSRSQKVLGACAPCKRAHLACEPSRPCKRCVSMSREDQCIDLPQKKRGRPKLSGSTAGAQALKISRTTPLMIEQPPHEPGQGGPLSAPAFSSSFSRTTPDGLPAPAPLPALLSSSAPTQSLFAVDYSLVSAPPGPLGRQRLHRPLSMILLTTTDFFLLRASDSSVEVLGKPAATLERSWMSDLLPSEDLLALFPLCQWLVSPPGVHLSTDPGTENAIEGATWPELTQPAEGTPYPEKEVRMQKADGTLIAVNLRMHLGRGAGLDFRRPDTFSKAYIVISCVVTHPSPPSSSHYMGPAATTPRPKSATSIEPDARPPHRPPTAFSDLLNGPELKVSDHSPIQRQQIRTMPSLPSISTLTHEVDLAQLSRSSVSSGGDLAPTFQNPFAPPPPSTRPPSQTFRFQQPRPQTGDGHRPRGIVLPPPTMIGFGPAGRLSSPGIYGIGGQHRPMSTESHLSFGGGSGIGSSHGFKDVNLPGFASFAARGSVASIESTISAAPSDGLWSPNPLADDGAFRRRGSALRTGTGDSTTSTGAGAMDGVVAQPLEPPSFPFPLDSLHPHGGPPSRQQ